jgi:hypothetical protein
MFGRGFVYVGVYEVAVAVLAMLLGSYSFIYHPEALVGILRFNEQEIVPLLIGLFPKDHMAQAEIGVRFFNAERWLILSEIGLAIKVIGVTARYLLSRSRLKLAKPGPPGSTS